MGGVARLYRLALEQGAAGARCHAVAAGGVAVVDIAERIGRGLGIPVVAPPPQEAAGRFGWLAAFAGWDMPASSARTRRTLDGTPTGPGLIVDLEGMRILGRDGVGIGPRWSGPESIC